MAIEYMGLNNIQGPLAVIEGVDDTFYEEMVTVTLDNGEKRIGRVIEISGDKAVIQVFEGTSNLSLTNTKTKFMGEPMRLPLSKEMPDDFLQISSTLYTHPRVFDTWFHLLQYRKYQRNRQWAQDYRCRDRRR